MTPRTGRRGGLRPPGSPGRTSPGPRDRPRLRGRFGTRPVGESQQLAVELGRGAGVRGVEGDPAQRREGLSAVHVVIKPRTCLVQDGKGRSSTVPRGAVEETRNGQAVYRCRNGPHGSGQRSFELHRGDPLDHSVADRDDVASSQQPRVGRQGDGVGALLDPSNGPTGHVVGGVAGPETKPEQRPPAKVDEGAEGCRSLLKNGAGPLLGGQRPRPRSRQCEGRGVPTVAPGQRGWQIDPAGLSRAHREILRTVARHDPSCEFHVA